MTLSKAELLEELKDGDDLGTFADDDQVSDDLRDDKEVALAAVAASASNYEYCSVRLQGDKDVMLAAICLDGVAFLRAGGIILESDHDLSQAFAECDRVLEELNYDPSILQYFPDDKRDDKEFITNIVECTAVRSGAGFALEHASARLRDDLDFVDGLCAHDPNAYKYGSERVKAILAQKYEPQPPRKKAKTGGRVA